LVALVDLSENAAIGPTDALQYCQSRCRRIIQIVEGPFLACAHHPCSRSVAAKETNRAASQSVLLAPSAGSRPMGQATRAQTAQSAASQLEAETLLSQYSLCR